MGVGWMCGKECCGCVVDVWWSVLWVCGGVCCGCRMDVW